MTMVEKRKCLKDRYRVAEKIIVKSHVFFSESLRKKLKSKVENGN